MKITIEVSDRSAVAQSNIKVHNHYKENVVLSNIQTPYRPHIRPGRHAEFFPALLGKHNPALTSGPDSESGGDKNSEKFSLRCPALEIKALREVDGIKNMDLRRCFTLFKKPVSLYTFLCRLHKILFFGVFMPFWGCLRNYAHDLCPHFEN